MPDSSPNRNPVAYVRVPNFNRPFPFNPSSNIEDELRLFDDRNAPPDTAFIEVNIDVQNRCRVTNYRDRNEYIIGSHRLDFSRFSMGDIRQISEAAQDVHARPVARSEQEERYSRYEGLAVETIARALGVLPEPHPTPPHPPVEPLRRDRAMRYEEMWREMLLAPLPAPEAPLSFSGYDRWNSSPRTQPRASRELLLPEEPAKASPIIIACNQKVG